MSIQIKDGVLAIIAIPSYKYKICDYLLVRDRTIRPGFDRIKSGLPGGGVEANEKHIDAMYRELYEEVGLEPTDFQTDLKLVTFHYKLRAGDICNKNFIFAGILSRPYSIKDLRTNDALEVSLIHSKSLMEMLGMYKYDLIHEGSMRILLLHELGIREGKLHEPVLHKGIYY